MTGSFLFVKPSDPEGKRGAAYSDESPRYPYDHASWEWLLERALRRTLLPWALTKSHSRVLLSGHEDKYSMHRWGSYGESFGAGTTPTDYQSVGGPGAHNRKTDADLLDDDREATLPESWNSSTGAPTYSIGTKVAYGVADLEETVSLLPFSLEWLHPGWSPSALNAWDLTAYTTETTQGSAPASPDGFDWTWRTTVDHIPYTIPNDVPFKCLSHMRTDDPIVTVNITNDNNETIEVETAPTPVSAPRTTDGSIRDYNGTQVRSALDGAAYAAGWALSEFSVLHRYGLDYSPSTSSVDYGRDGKTSETYDVDNSTLGCLVDIPDKDSGNIVVYEAVHDEWARFVHDVNWGDNKQTWWHANGFPKGLDSVLSQRLKTQLNALCPVCQPAIPPAVPAFWEKFPDAGLLPWNHLIDAFLYASGMYPHRWMQHISLACTPFDMSARLDAMTTTVHRVPTLFAKIRKVTTEYSTSRNDYTETDPDGYKSQSWEASTNREIVTVEGTSSNPIPAGNALMSVSGQASGVTNHHGKRSGPTWSSSWSDKTQYTWEESFESKSDFLVCLRSTANTTLSTKTTTTKTSTDESSYNGPNRSESEDSYGSLPDAYDPDPDDLLFPDWVLPWIESAELFVAIESRLGRYGGTPGRTESDYRYYPVAGEDTFSYSGSGSGSRTHKTRHKIISLGQMDTSTGRFPALDAAAVLSEVDPDPTEPTGWHHWESYDTSTTETTDSNGNRTERVVLVVKNNVRNSRSRSVSYYVVVKWKFDRTDPETLGTESQLAGLYRKLVDSMKALSYAQSDLQSAQSDLQSAQAALARAQEQLADPEGSEADLLKEAKSKLDLANQELSDTQSEKSDAQLESAVAESDMWSTESSLQSAQEAYDSAVAAGDGVEEARAALESAYTAYYGAVEAYSNASSRLADAEANETVARLEADAAQDYYDTLHDKLEEILQKAVADAEAAIAEATSRVNELTRKIAEAEGAIPSLEAGVETAKQAIRDAGGDVLSSSRTSWAGI